MQRRTRTQTPIKEHQKSSTIIPLGGDETTKRTVYPTPKNKKRRTKRLKRRTRHDTDTNTNNTTTILDYLVLALFFTIIAGLIFGSAFGLIFCISYVLDPYRPMFRHSFYRHDALDLELYELVYKNATGGDDDTASSYYQEEEEGEEKKKGEEEGGEILIPTINPVLQEHMSIPPFEPGYDYTFSYGDDVMERGCELTVVLMDPRIPMRKGGAPIWFTLESVAAFLPNACVLIQTAKCEIEKQHEEETTTSTSKDDEEDDFDAGRVIYDRIYRNSLPLFRKLMEKGQLRVTFLNHQKYHLKSCSNFYNPSAALMNVNYWIDEFVEDVDSDTVLNIQDDAVLCHSFDVESMGKFAFVGGVWPTTESLCFKMPIYWKTWTLPQQEWEKHRHGDDKNNKNNNKLNRAGGRKVKKRTHNKPDYLVDLTFPELCTGDGEAPVGNGGFSLRSRKWMVRAVETCPHKDWSGFDVEYGVNVACKLIEEVNEDVYFGTVLRGMGAPMPTAYEASLFSLEMIWPEESVGFYGGPTGRSEQEEITRRLWGDEQESFGIYGGVSFGDNEYTVPIGMHKPWWYKPNALLLGDDVSDQCPFLKYMYEPIDSKWSETKNDGENQPWRGIGT